MSRKKIGVSPETASSLRGFSEWLQQRGRTRFVAESSCGHVRTAIAKGYSPPEDPEEWLLDHYAVSTASARRGPLKLYLVFLRGVAEVEGTFAYADFGAWLLAAGLKRSTASQYVSTMRVFHTLSEGDQRAALTKARTCYAASQCVQWAQATGVPLVPSLAAYAEALVSSERAKESARMAKATEAEAGRAAAKAAKTPRVFPLVEQLYQHSKIEKEFWPLLAWGHFGDPDALGHVPVMKPGTRPGSYFLRPITSPEGVAALEALWADKLPSGPEELILSDAELDSILKSRRKS